MKTILLKNCREIVHSVDGKPKIGADLSIVETLNECDILLENGKISKIEKAINVELADEIIDCSDKTVIPGFVDAHTHPVFDGDRSNEFGMKLAGASYMEIHAAGGGIHYTVQKTKKALEDVLVEKMLARLDQMISQGTLTIEAKSGYGLELETEIKMLKVIKKAQEKHKMNIQSTYLCAHAVPIGKNPEEMTKEIVEKHIPTVAQMDLNVKNIDVFCEEGVYNVDQSRRMLAAGHEQGWITNAHVEEIVYLGGAEMCCELGNCRALSHLEMVSEEAIKMMAETKVAGVILPTTAYILKLVPPPVRKMIENNVIVALASDYNPNAPCFSMPMVMHLACILCKMNMEEAFNAATINSAYSIGLENETGSITIGKNANLLVLDSPNWKHIIYQLGNHQNLIEHKIINGFIV